MQTPFGSYRGGYNVMPAGYMDAWLQVGKNYGDMIKSVGTSVAGGITKGQDMAQDKTKLQGSLPTQYSMYEKVSQASGQAIDPTLAERYKNIGQMSLPQMQSFEKDLAASQQMQMNIANMQRQAQAYQMQQQAMQRAAQQSQLEALGRSQDAYLNVPRAMPAQMYSAPSVQSAYGVPSLNQFSGMPFPGVGTIR